MELDLEERNDIFVSAKPSFGIAISSQGKLLVVRKAEEAGGDDVVEQYSILPIWLMTPEKVHCPLNGGIESVCFVGEQIVCTHLNGSITIMNPHKPETKRVQIGAVPLWSSCAIDSNRVAFVSHSAQVYVFDIAGNQIISSKSLGVDQRLFSVAASGNLIAVGATGVITILENQNIKRELQVERQDKRLPTIVWALQFVKSGRVLASGDSRGFVSFWNCADGALLKALHSHQADVLALTVVNNEVIAAGVDPRLVVFVDKGANNWQTITTKTGPKTDVRGLANFCGRVIAAGADSSIYVSKTVGTHIMTADQCKNILTGGKITVARGTNYVDIWTAGESSGKVQPDGTVEISRDPTYFCRLNSQGKQFITAVALSSDGSYLAISTGEGTSSYVIKSKNKKAPIKRTELRGPPTTALAISSSTLFLCVSDFQIVSLPINGGDETIVLEQTGCGEVALLTVSPSASYLAVLTTRTEVYVVEVGAGKSKPFKTDLPSALSFASDDALLVLVAEPLSSESVKEKRPWLYQVNPKTSQSVRQFRYAELFPKESFKLFSHIVGISSDVINGRAAIIRKDGSFVIMDTHVKSEASPVCLCLESGGGVACGGGDDSNRCDSWAVGWRPDGTLSVVRLPEPEPTVEPFKLKKFGQN